MSSGVILAFFRPPPDQNWKLADNYRLAVNKFGSISPSVLANFDRYGIQSSAKLELYINELISQMSPISETIISLVEFFVQSIEDFYLHRSEFGHLNNVQREFKRLHCGQEHQVVCQDLDDPNPGESKYKSYFSPLPLNVVFNLITPIKCWQEPIFENVELLDEPVHSDRHTAATAELVNIRRTSMLVLGQRENENEMNRPGLVPLDSCYPQLLLLVTHNGNKLSLYDLVHLLTQIYAANSRVKKITPNRLATVQLPFDIMSISANPVNDELVAVVGMKELQVLHLDRLHKTHKLRPIPLGVELGNNLIKTFWLPDRPAQLVVLTEDFVKIYDLTLETGFQDPLYHFVFSQHKFHDATFFSTCPTAEQQVETNRCLLITSASQIFVEHLQQENVSTPADPKYYVTSVLNVALPGQWSLASNQTSIAYSIHYSHRLQMLFVSYSNGHSLCAPLNNDNLRKLSIDKVG